MFTEHVQYSRGERADATRRRVIDCAQRLFRESGFASTTIRRIATEADVSVGTVMGVGDKDAILLAAYDSWIGDVHTGRVGPSIGPDGADATDQSVVDGPAARIGELVQPFLDLFAADLPLAREYLAILNRGRHRTAVFGDLAATLTEEFAKELRAAGLGDTAEAAARTVYLAYLGSLLATAARGADIGDVRRQLDAVVAVVLGAVRPTSE